MHKIYTVATALLFLLLIQSCSKKTIPTRTTPVVVEVKSDTLMVVKSIDSLEAKKPVITKSKPKTSIPKIITLNDKYAKKSVDGRYYYDLAGHRYWRNNKDGKYYLFNKSMLTDEDFKKP